jgi:Meiotically up-regulated gene 113
MTDSSIIRSWNGRTIRQREDGVETFQKTFLAHANTPRSHAERMLKSLDVGCVYIIKSPSSGLMKIGKSRKLFQRMKTLEVSCGEKLELVLSIETLHKSFIEKTLHDHYAEYRKAGEWFYPFPLGNTDTGITHNLLRKEIRLMIDIASESDAKCMLELPEIEEILYEVCTAILRTGSVNAAIKERFPD